MNHSQPHDTPAPPSKSQRKRESSALQDIGKMLVQLPTERVRNLDLPEALRAAVLEAQRISSHGALRRQMQYIGRLMRDVDPEPIVEQLTAIRGASDSAKAEFHVLERWRERLLADDAALTDWLAIHPRSDAQQLRQLIRNARREAAEGKPPRASRALFRMLAEGYEKGNPHIDAT
jgi:ribosome-associated protein